MFLRRMIPIVLLIGLSCNIWVSRGYASESSAQDSLQGAFQKEQALLLSQKQMLEKRLGELTNESERRTASLMRDIDLMQQEQSRLALRGRELSESLAVAEGANESDDALLAVMDATRLQAEASLKKFPVGSQLPLQTLSPEETKGLNGQLSALSQHFEQALLLLKNAGMISAQKGEFFLNDGSKIIGTITRIGYSASFGNSAEASGALVPAGEGRLRLWEGEVGDTIELLQGKSASPVAHLFLYESAEKPVESKKKKSLKDVLDGGGSVAYVLVALGIVTLLLVVMKTLVLHRASRNADRLVTQIADCVHVGELESALEHCRKNTTAYAKVLEAVLANLTKSRKVVEDVISEVLIKEGNTVDKFGSFVVVIAAAAPLLGLLGTVSGMIHTFDIITEYGDSDPKLLSSGISEALIDTMLGLIVAIPALLCGNYLATWAERVKDGMEKSCLHILTAWNEFELNRASRETRDA